jgi:hypothetical protein
MNENAEKRMAMNYEITLAVRIGGKEVILGVDDTCADPYLCCLCTCGELFDRFEDCSVGDSYAEAMALFGQKIQKQAEMVLEEQAKTTIPLEPLTMEDCYPNDYGKSIVGKVVAIKRRSLAPEYRAANHQLMYVTGGGGAYANSRGNACFCINLYNGKHTRWERYDIQGEVKPERLPEWAKDRLTVVECEQISPQREGR